MSIKKVLLLSISIILFSVASNAQEKTAIICGKLITAEDNKVYTNIVIIINADKIGSIKVGKLADIITTKENPIDDIFELTRVEFVMKGGKIIKKIK